MFEIEARHLIARLAEVPAGALSPMINIGSGTLKHRSIDNPWIERVLIGGLKARGIDVVHVDAREGEGIDIRADLFDAAQLAKIKMRGPRSVLCTNVLEHVEELARFCGALADLVGPGGYLIVTVPHSYPYHRDPIDTMFRPTPQEIAALFPGFNPVVMEIQDTESYWYKLRQRPWLILRQILRAPFPFLGFTKWKRSMSKLYWLFAPYRQSVFIGVKA
jgi:SAM-dependent methyltransferase